MSANIDTIVIVEDDAQTVALFNHMLSNNCMNVVSISSNKLYQLEEIVQNHEPRLIILDYMSISRYYERTVKQLQTVIPNIPTVVITTMDDDTLSTSFDYTIRKPFYKSDLIMIIQDIVQRSF